MDYIDKLNKLKNNLDNLENKTKKELIEFVTLIIDMSIAREEGNRHADKLMEIVYENEATKKLFGKCEKEKKELDESWRKLYTQVTDEFTEEIKRLEDVTGYQLDILTEKLKNGELKIVKGE